jgi:protein-S-isoprenylcysteine O-methyltransferase Ste14
MQGQITEPLMHFWLVLLIFALAAQTFILLLWVNAPYGRFSRAGWGPSIPTRVAWVLFESPAVIVFAAVFLAGQHARETAPLVLFAVWQFHYVARAFIFPLRMRETGKRMPVVIVLMAVVFNILNAYINARWISHIGSYGNEWLASAPFLVGLAMFAAGWLINQHADRVLLTLRNPGETHYSIPQGGMYRFLSCPNYFGEMLEWAGWAVMTWSLAGLAFAVFTVANLLPRALATHRWYREQFPDYPPARRAVIPFLL